VYFRFLIFLKEGKQSFIDWLVGFNRQLGFPLIILYYPKLCPELLSQNQSIPLLITKFLFLSNHFFHFHVFPDIVESDCHPDMLFNYLMISALASAIDQIERNGAKMTPGMKCTCK
jgi:hypothetical protein